MLTWRLGVAARRRRRCAPTSGGTDLERETENPEALLFVLPLERVHYREARSARHTRGRPEVEENDASLERLERERNLVHLPELHGRRRFSAPSRSGEDCRGENDDGESFQGDVSSLTRASMQERYPDRTSQDSDRSDDGRRERARCAHRPRRLVFSGERKRGIGRAQQVERSRSRRRPGRAIMSS